MESNIKQGGVLGIPLNRTVGSLGSVQDLRGDIDIRREVKDGDSVRTGNDGGLKLVQLAFVYDLEDGKAVGVVLRKTDGKIV
jgi:hypothetical protein